MRWRNYSQTLFQKIQIDVGTEKERISEGVEKYKFQTEFRIGPACKF